MQRGRVLHLGGLLGDVSTSTQHAGREADYPGLLQDGATWRQVPALRGQRASGGREAEAAQGASAGLGQPHSLRGLHPTFPRHAGPGAHAGGGAHSGKLGVTRDSGLGEVRRPSFEKRLLLGKQGNVLSRFCKITKKPSVVCILQTSARNVKVGGAP